MPLLPAASELLKRSLTFPRTFDNESLTLIAYISGENNAPYLTLRSFHQGREWYSLRGIHELRIRRGRSSVELRRWSHSANAPKIWAALCFLTWEGMSILRRVYVWLKALDTMFRNGIVLLHFQ